MPNNNPGSPRMAFQWKYVDDFVVHNPILSPDDEPRILNVGSADDPLGFGPMARHVDIDDWSYKHRYFTQADIHNMPFKAKEFPLVLVGDVMEHVKDPQKATIECCRVCGDVVVFTIFEEWRLPGYGQFIEEGHKLGDREAQKYGAADREVHQRVMYPERIGFDDEAETHLVHVNQFTDQDMTNLVLLIISLGFKELELLKAYEAEHEGHRWYNWLMAFKRIGAR